MREGYLEAQARAIGQETPDRFTRKWLQLRIGAFHRERAFDQAVTPELIRSIDVAHCPVLRIALTHGEMKDSDWSVDRINNDGAYALHNLAVISSRANTAKGKRSFGEVFELAQGDDTVDGLTPREWMRLANVMLGPCFIETPGLMPILPLTAPIPLHTARFAAQVIQQLITLTAKRPSGKNLLIKHFKRACASEASQMRLVRMIEAVHVGLKGLDYPWDVWLSEAVMKAFLDWHDGLDAKGRAQTAAIALNQSPVNIVNTGSTLHTWNLGAGGYSTF
ncbi:MAG: hypothetical protein V4582_15030 [Pseudomonadota bacterium]